MDEMIPPVTPPSLLQPSDPPPWATWVYWERRLAWVVTAVFLVLGFWGRSGQERQAAELKRQGEVLHRVEEQNRAMDAKLMELTQRLKSLPPPERR